MNQESCSWEFGIVVRGSLATKPPMQTTNWRETEYIIYIGVSLSDGTPFGVGLMETKKGNLPFLGVPYFNTHPYALHHQRSSVASPTDTFTWF